MRGPATAQERVVRTPVCALRSLAGMITPGAPGTYRLPSDLDGKNGPTP
jgi:hypothetical protein